jgi:predicted ester cyclase
MLRYRVLCFMAVLSLAVTTTPAQKKPAPNVRQPVQERPNVSKQQNKLMARRVFEELTNQGRYEAVDEVFDRNCKVHFGNRTVGLSQAVAEGKGWKSAAPDMFMNVENISENGDKVTVTWSAKGTHTGQGLGVKPTRRQVSMSDRSEFLIKNGKIVEVWNSEYRTELHRQLGISKTAASMMDRTEDLWATLSARFPDPLYAALH